MEYFCIVVKERKTKTSYALSSEARQLVEELARALGVSQAAVIEMSVRKLARAEGVTLPKTGKEEERPDGQR